MSNVCKFCGQAIDWKDEKGKPKPYNPNGTAHNCRGGPKLEPGPTPQSQSTAPKRTLFKIHWGLIGETDNVPIPVGTTRLHIVPVINPDGDFVVIFAEVTG